MSSEAAPPSGCPVKHDAAPGCPVKHSSQYSAPPAAFVPPHGGPVAIPDACPMSSSSSAAALMAAGSSGSAPLPPREFLPGAPTFPVAYRIREESGTGVVGDVFPDSRPILGQRIPLSTLPSRSSIPKAAPKPDAAAAAAAAGAAGAAALPKTASNAVVAPEDAPARVGTLSLGAGAGAGAGSDPSKLVCTSDSLGADATEETWTFPSQQRFYNAMKKKGWNPREEDLPYIVSIHNTINEQCWRRVMEYEALHSSSCSSPKLLRFQGLPTDYSVKARLKSWLGYVLPFDRHDWIVDRCGKEVRYIIDFYNGPEDPTRPATVFLDVRPAPTPAGMVDRARVWWKGLFTI